MFFCIHCRAEIDSKFKACPHCGEPITDFLRRHLEEPLDGKYQILGKLGVGGMGEVYKALHVHLNALRVLKLMRANIANDPGSHERFLREARLATRIHHPNVAALFDFSTLGDDAHYMVWEYIEGINLHELIVEKGPLSPRYAARLAIQALHGLDAIHRAGIVHRDISPENLMITRDEEGEEHVKIIDLGIAKQSKEEGDTRTKTGMFVGKWKYCSPEHLGMLPAGERIDGRADLYSFGIVLYEMLTGVPPFQADTPHRFVMMHASVPPRSLRSVNPSVTASARVVSPPRRQTAWIVGVLAAVIAAGVMVMRKPNQLPTNSTVTVEQPHVDTTAPVAMAQGYVSINAFPWANVTSIRNLDNGATVELQGPLVTPAPIDLAPGRYEITLSNPAFRQSVTQTVEVRANKESSVTARFEDPALVALPRFEAQP